MKLGLIVRMDKTGLGQGQTKRLARMLQPESIMMINSKPFNNNDQFPEWYSNIGSFRLQVDGFPNDLQVRTFLDSCDVVISCETFYSNTLTRMAKELKKKTILIANYEFFDWHKPEFSIVQAPDKIVMPSYWHLKEMHDYWNASYLPTPIFDDEFVHIRDYNLNRNTDTKRFLFLNGKSAAHDRNGLKTLYEALAITEEWFDVVIKSQSKLEEIADPRITYDYSDPEDQAELYNDFDALIMPRRYAGQCLPMTEALLCAMPVIMLNIDPNDKILPQKWLIPAEKSGSFMTRKQIDIYSGDGGLLADMMDNIDISLGEKYRAYYTGLFEFDAQELKPKYEELINSWN